MLHARLNIAFLVAVAVFASARVHAQVPKSSVTRLKPGNLDGEVVNTKGAPVAGAQILWQASDGETPHVLHTDSQGRFHVGPLRAGSYDLRASANGTWSEWEHNILVRPGSDANITLRLKYKEPPPPPALN